jgi:putative phage-type endonuclease
MKSISTVGMTHDEWLEERKNGIGGSDSAAIFNLNPWMTSYDLYLSKKGKAEPIEETERMKMGNVMEPVIAQLFSERENKKIARINKILIHPKYSFIRSNIDYRILHEKEYLECKNVDGYIFKKADWGKEYTSDIPQYYYCQGNHYSLFPQFSNGGWLAAVVGGNQLKVYRLPFDKEMYQMLINGYCTWWDNFQKNIPPEVVNMDDAQKRWSESFDESIEATKEIKEMSEKIALHKGNIKESEFIIEHCTLEIVKFMQNCAILNYDGNKINSWKSQSRTGIDVKRLKKELPDIAEKYSKTSTTRVFR